MASLSRSLSLSLPQFTLRNACSHLGHLHIHNLNYICGLSGIRKDICRISTTSLKKETGFRTVSESNFSTSAGNNLDKNLDNNFNNLHNVDNLESPKAGALIIGNEILTGKIQDTNTATLAKTLFSRGVDLVKAEVVRDVRGEIVDSVQRLRDQVGPNGFVFTSGGIGPTHDDITYEAIASAFGLKLALHEETAERMRVYYESQGKTLNGPRLRMATLPEGCEVLYTPGLWVPLVVLQNVYILPGIPRLFTQMLNANKERFSGPLSTAFILYTHQGEGDLAEPLTRIALEFADVAIGSYPSTEVGDGFTTRLSFEGRDSDSVRKAVAQAEAQITCFKKE